MCWLGVIINTEAKVMDTHWFQYDLKISAAHTNYFQTNKTNDCSMSLTLLNYIRHM